MQLPMCAAQVKWKDLVSDLNLVPTTLDPERTGGVDLGLGTIPMPFASFKKSECACAQISAASGSTLLGHLCTNIRTAARNQSDSSHNWADNCYTRGTPLCFSTCSNVAQCCAQLSSCEATATLMPGLSRVHGQLV